MILLSCGLIAVVALFLLIFVVGAYNSLVTLRNRYKNAYSQIDVQLKRRYDLIPNLVETAKGYLSHERGTLEAVIAARNAAATANTRAAQNPGDASAMKELSSAESALGGVMGRLFALAEAYPDLKANTTMLNLMEELTSTENKVSFARQAYNDSVMARSFPHQPHRGSLQLRTGRAFRYRKAGTKGSAQGFVLEAIP
jgi:LemA protein